MILLNIIVFLIFVLLWFITKKYEIDIVSSLDVKKYPLKVLFPLGFFIMDRLQLNKKKASDNLDEPLKALYVGEQVDYIKRLYLCNKVVMAVLIIFAGNFFAMISNLQDVNNKQILDGKYLQRPGYDEGTKSVELQVNIADKDLTVLEEDVHIDVEENRYDKEEIIKKFQYAKDYIDSHILNKNESPEKIQSDLNFISKIPKTGISVTWATENNKLIDTKGKIQNEDIKEGVLVWVTAVLTYYDHTEEYTRYFKVLPKEYTKEELVRKSLTDALTVADEQSKTEDRLALPDLIQQQQVTWAEKTDNTGWMFLVSGVVLAIILYILMDRDIYGKVEKRNREMLLDYPEIINKFTLLVGAGMSLSNAWCKLSKDYKDKGVKKRYAYEEMVITYGELMVGTSETTAYERFGRRVKLIPYLRFSSLLAQNVKKGSAGLLSQLELEASEAFEERKELAKRIGEEARTKLLGPMMFMLIIVLAVIMVPAFLSFQI
ncbi:MAG: hypothetical protein WCD89_10285 [Anaerocolumna sp.]